MTEPQVADLVRAFAPYAWPASVVVSVVILRESIGSALLRIAERIQRGSLKTPAGQVTFDMGQATDDARTSLDVLGGVKQKLEQESLSK